MGSQYFTAVSWRNAFCGFLALLMVVGLSGCASRGGNIPYAPADFAAPDKRAPEDVAYDLPVGPLDMVKVDVFRVPELSGDYQVDAKGMLTMPLIGAVSVREMSPTALAQNLAQRYGQRYLNNPQITVRVTNSVNNNVTVEGGVNMPGLYPLATKTTLVGAIALARGVNSTDANPRRVIVFRKNDGKTMAAAFDLVSIRRGEMEDPIIYPGDTVVVDSSSMRAIYRDLLQAIPLVTIFQYL